MNIDYLLKKEGITNVKELKPTQIKTIAKDLAIKLCLAFPEHDMDRQSLYTAFCSLDMFTASMPNDSSGAKYISGSNSIYFNNTLDFSTFPEVAMHECIHFLQEAKFSSNGNLIGLSNLALNEAAVQLMASEANMSDMTEEKYYDITLKTISPNYYPLECALINEIVYFTGTYSLYHSLLNSNDIFKNTFIAKFSKKIYEKFVKQLDKLLQLENDVNDLISELQLASNSHSIKHLNNSILKQKKEITNLFFSIQNFIISNCFSCEFNSISTMEDLTDFKNKLYNFKAILGTTSNYTYYNEFYCSLMNAVENKKEEILKYGEISLFKQECTALTISQKAVDKFNFARIFLTKLHKLFKLNTGTVSEYDKLN